MEGRIEPGAPASVADWPERPLSETGGKVKAGAERCGFGALRCAWACRLSTSGALPGFPIPLDLTTGHATITLSRAVSVRPASKQARRHMALTNTATAHWAGDLKTGKGKISTGSGALDGLPYDFRKRFEGEKGSNPEELIGAAHAGCFSMALSAELGKAGLTAEAIDTKATVTLDFIEGVPTVTKVHLDLTARVPGASTEAFTTAANGAKANCPISRLLKAEITMDARLE